MFSFALYFWNTFLQEHVFFILGMLSQTIKLKPRDHMGFTYRKRDFSPCTYLTAITTHRLNETEIKDLHSLIHKTDFRKCKKKPTPKSKFFSIFGLIDIYIWTVFVTSLILSELHCVSIKNKIESFIIFRSNLEATSWSVF